MGEKIDLVQAHRAQYGFNACLSAIGLSKGTWHHRQHRTRQQHRDAELKKEIVAIITEHPEYGYRRIQHEMVERLGLNINAKRIRRVLATYDLQLKRSVASACPKSRLPACSSSAKGISHIKDI